jgi:exodeoxyribonuclease V gamma subunit
MAGNGRVLRPHSLIGLWVKHLAACAQGLDLTSCLVAPDGIVRLQAVDPRAAASHLDAIIAHVGQGLSQPLPVTAKTAMAYLQALLADDALAPLNAEKAARKAYEGDGYNQAGELGHSGGAYLQRCFPDFDALFEARGRLFATLARELYEPLALALRPR